MTEDTPVGGSDHSAEKDRISRIIAEHQYGGQWARYGTETEAPICRCGSEYQASHLHQHQADMLIAATRAIDPITRPGEIGSD